MELFAAVFFCFAASVAADTPPLPYAAAAGSASSAASYPSSFSALGEDPHQASGPYVQQYNHGAEGFNIQSGFEGYLVPSSTGIQTTALLVPIRDGLEYLSSGAGISHLVKFFSGKGLRLIPKIVLSVVGVAGLFLLGCVLTTAICTFTPFCSISFFGWGVARESMRSFLTEDRITATAAFVTEAIRKYQELYGRESAANGKETQVKN